MDSLSQTRASVAGEEVEVGGEVGEVIQESMPEMWTTLWDHSTVRVQTWVEVEVVVVVVVEVEVEEVEEEHLRHLRLRALGKPMEEESCLKVESRGL